MTPSCSPTTDLRPRTALWRTPVHTRTLKHRNTQDSAHAATRTNVPVRPGSRRAHSAAHEQKTCTAGGAKVEAATRWTTACPVQVWTEEMDYYSTSKVLTCSHAHSWPTRWAMGTCRHDARHTQEQRYGRTGQALDDMKHTYATPNVNIHLDLPRRASC